MATWSKDESHKIAEADDLPIAPFRENGVTYGTPTWIWSVAVDDTLYTCAPTTRGRWTTANRRISGAILPGDGTTRVRGGRRT